MRDEVLPRSGTERQPQGRRPGALAAPSPGVSTRDTPPPVLDSDAAAEQSHARLCRGTQVLQPVGVVPLKGFSAAGHGTRFQPRRLSGLDTDPRGRHDGLRAAPQRGQAPPPVPPPATPESPERGPIGHRRRCPTHSHTFGFQPHCLLQPGSARPFKGSFSELKVSDKEAPAPSALLLAFDNQRVPLTTIQLANKRESRQLAPVGAASRNAGTCSPGAHRLLAEAQASSSHSYRELAPPPESRWSPVSRRLHCSRSKTAGDSETGENYGLEFPRTGVGLLL